jgi:hypothetical protein
MNDGNYFQVINEFIRNREEAIRNIREGKNLPSYFIGANLTILVSAFLYGMVMGSFVDARQMVFDSVKMPLLLLLSAYITLPVFYVIDTFSDSKIDIYKTTVLVLSCFMITAFIMTAFIPIVLMFSLTTYSHAFMQLLNTAICSLAGLCGIMYFMRASHEIRDNKDHYPALLISIFTMILVATQLVWVLRPYLHSTDGFLESGKGNFYVEMANAASAEPGSATILGGVFFMVALLIILKFLGESRRIVIYNSAEQSPDTGTIPGTRE